MKLPDNNKLEEIYEKGIKIHKSITLLNESIERRQHEIKELNKTSVMKKYRTHVLMITTTNNHIVAEHKKLKKLFDIIKK